MNMAHWLAKLLPQKSLCVELKMGVTHKLDPQKCSPSVFHCKWKLKIVPDTMLA